MNKKITRRALLGTTILGLVAAPFAVVALRRGRTVELESMLDRYQRIMSIKLSFPREFNMELMNTYMDDGRGLDFNDPSLWPPAPSEEIRDKIFATQKRYWQNYSKLDEVRFILTSGYYVNGKLYPSCCHFIDTEVYIKFGYGVEVKGKNTLGKKVHLVFNLDEDNQPEGPERCNLAGFTFGTFSMGQAWPWYAKRYTSIEENVALPDSFQQTYKNFPAADNFELRPDGLYTLMKGPSDDVDDGKASRRCYFSQKTGMLELTLIENDTAGVVTDFAPLYEAYVCEEINGIYFPVKYNGAKIWRDKEYSWKDSYSNIRFKLIS